jgi:hypothetical protein
MAVRFVREEATMAAITFNTAYRKQHARAQLDTIFAAFREMLDVFVSNRMQRAAAEAEYALPLQFQGRRTHRAGLQ